MTDPRSRPTDGTSSAPEWLVDLVPDIATSDTDVAALQLAHRQELAPLAIPSYPEREERPYAHPESSPHPLSEISETETVADASREKDCGGHGK
jgi:hypothetical protein